MANITQERLQELVAIYDALKARIYYVDEKYSLDFVEPKLDMPDSLYLTKLEYTPKSEEELLALAEQQVEAYVIAKQASLYRSYNTKAKSLSAQRTKLKNDTDKKLAALNEEKEKEKESIRRRLVNNGLIFSSFSLNYETDTENKYKAKSDAILADTSKQLELSRSQQEQVTQAYQESLASLEQEKQARIRANYQKLQEAEEALARNIEKYNTGLDEKEAKYQASRARAYESARRAAYTRAYNNSKLYMEMGETGYRRMIEREKYALAQDAFYPLRRDEAKAILSFDAFLMTHLGTYYSAFVDWVNTTLLP